MSQFRKIIGLVLAVSALAPSAQAWNCLPDWRPLPQVPSATDRGQFNQGYYDAANMDFVARDIVSVPVFTFRSKGEKIGGFEAKKTIMKVEIDCRRGISRIIDLNLVRDYSTYDIDPAGGLGRWMSFDPDSEIAFIADDACRNGR